MDALTEVLHGIRLAETYYSRTELRAPWGLGMPGADCACFHFVARGTCWLRVDGAEPIAIGRGDLVFIPRGAPHGLSDAPDTPLRSVFELPRERLSDNAAILRHGGDGNEALLVCGGVRFDAPGTPLVELLPDVMHLRGIDGRNEELFSLTLQLVATEVGAPRVGSEAVVTRLFDLLVIAAVREWIETRPEGRAGWLAALRDAQIGRALALIHGQPDREWSLVVRPTHADPASAPDRGRSRRQRSLNCSSRRGG